MKDFQKDGDFFARLRVLIRAIYETPKGGCGCCLHIVLDDGNLEDFHINWCLNTWIPENHPEHGICIEVANMLLQLTEAQREKVLNWG